MKELEPMEVWVVEDYPYGNNVHEIFASQTDALEFLEDKDPNDYLVYKSVVRFPSLRRMYEISETLRRRLEKYSELSKAIQQVEQKFKEE